MTILRVYHGELKVNLFQYKDYIGIILPQKG